jgi:hypothetical protein
MSDRTPFVDELLDTGGPVVRVAGDGVVRP